MAAEGGEVARAERKLDAADNELSDAKGELRDAKAKLEAAEAELRTAKAETPSDVQRVAEAKLGVAEAKLGVAKAELGVAKAEWEAAAEGGKQNQLWKLVETAQESVKTAQKIVNAATMAYQNTLSAAAPPHDAQDERETRVDYRLWEGSKVACRYASPSSLYQTACEAFPDLSLVKGHFTLYLLPDLLDISTRVKVEAEPPFTKARLIFESPPTLLLLYRRPPNDTSPAKLPAPIARAEVSSSARESQTGSSGSRGQVQKDFRSNVMRLSGWKDYLTGADLQQNPGEGGLSGEACHIIPVKSEVAGLDTKEKKWELLEKLGQPPNLDIPANGIPLLPDYHHWFDRFELSVSPDNCYKICVWNGIPNTATNVTALRDKVAALNNNSSIAARQLLKWHHEVCADKHNEADTGKAKKKKKK